MHSTLSFECALGINGWAWGIISSSLSCGLAFNGRAKDSIALNCNDQSKSWFTSKKWTYHSEDVIVYFQLHMEAKAGVWERVCEEESISPL